MIPAVTYVRVSTEEQDPENQRVFLERWAAERGLYILRHYVDVGVSGATEPWERPAFRQMAAEVEKLDPRPKVLLVYEISRLVRSFQELFALLDVVENKMGLVVVSASEREQALQNLDGVYRQFLRAVLAFVATMEREFIRQRTKTALERARARGRIWNVAERRGDIAKAVVDMYTSGASLRETARAFGLSLYEVRRILSEAGVYRPTAYSCPRCFSRLKVVERTAKVAGGRYTVTERLYCPNCGYEEVREA
ncbi:recombinase family protein [Pyrobaculum neutrophilum]|uniref:Resolvase domain n=1 Tax=Pyrobaculum neutrophilum (strain DSM 2338 / JCM 9278 / NBRC 100436 / V24Sta) TaxID=444157 RepID=B1YDF0_PYRNV|nr:recombinase family protein [Pyrobaculum neutrophilum]ACB39813.1 Resolvase domain [Pyrobaculum neutrophilum V24Sta]